MDGVAADGQDCIVGVEYAVFLIIGYCVVFDDRLAGIEVDDTKMIVTGYVVVCNRGFGTARIVDPGIVVSGNVIVTNHR